MVLPTIPCLLLVCCAHLAAWSVLCCRYIEYESKLEELRSSRRKSRGISGKKALAEFCIIRRIHFIYERATRKFRCGQPRGGGGFSQAAGRLPGRAAAGARALHRGTRYFQAV